jgi:hypothetical protein
MQIDWEAERRTGATANHIVNSPGIHRSTFVRDPEAIVGVDTGDALTIFPEIDVDPRGQWPKERKPMCFMGVV